MREPDNWEIMALIVCIVGCTIALGAAIGMASEAIDWDSFLRW